MTSVAMFNAPAMIQSSVEGPQWPWVRMNQPRDSYNVRGRWWLELRTTKYLCAACATLCTPRNAKREMQYVFAMRVVHTVLSLVPAVGKWLADEEYNAQVSNGPVEFISWSRCRECRV